MQVDLESIQQSNLMNYLAEVFYEEYCFLTKNHDDGAQEMWVRQEGVNSRAFSKDVLDLSHHTYISDDVMRDAIFLHLSRNSIYHQLPEFIFHPISIRKPSMGTKDVVEAMKKNKKRENENIHFFIPFDTELFMKKLRLTNRHLHIFSSQEALEVVFSVARQLINKEIPLTKKQYYMLFLSLCNAEELKENLPELETFFECLLGEKIVLKYSDQINESQLFLPIGSGRLGMDLGIQGDFVLEQQDVLATVVLQEAKPFDFFERIKRVIQDILEFFVFSNRAIRVAFRYEAKEAFLLGENFLGLDTKLKGTEVLKN